jgi:hypothetical protein
VHLFLSRIARLEEDARATTTARDSTAVTRGRELERELEQRSRELASVQEETSSLLARVHELEEQCRRAGDAAALPTSDALVGEVVARCDAVVLAPHHQSAARVAWVEEANRALEAEKNALRDRAGRAVAAGKELAEVAERAAARQHAAEAAALKSTHEAVLLLDRERETVRVLQRRLVDAEAEVLHHNAMSSVGTSQHGAVQSAASRTQLGSSSPTTMALLSPRTRPVTPDDRVGGQLNDSTGSQGSSGTSATAGSLAAKLVECNRRVCLVGHCTCHRCRRRCCTHSSLPVWWSDSVDLSRPLHTHLTLLSAA